MASALQQFCRYIQPPTTPSTSRHLYAYKQLQHADSIRILELSPFDPVTSRLHGRLVEARLGEQPEYFAFSYAWGPANFTQSIQISVDDDGHDDEHDDVQVFTTMHITETLFEALKELGSDDTGPSGVFRIWVDQICINQADMTEKGHQVAAMDRVFSQAQKVVGWLGVDADNSGLVMTLLKYDELVRKLYGKIFDENARPHLADWQAADATARELWSKWDVSVPRPYYLVLNAFGSAPRIFDRQVFSPKYFHITVTWTRLLKRSWFKRLWIVQEIALSRELEIRCGSVTVPAVVFFGWLDNEFALYLGPGYENIMERMRSLWNIKKLDTFRRPHAFVNLAHRLQRWDCQDERDKLNALCGISFSMAEPAEMWFTPSYSLPTPELYLRFATGYALSSETEGLNLLHCAGLGLSPGSDATCTQPWSLPSWVPDWRINDRPTALLLEPDMEVQRRPGSKRFGTTRSRPEYCLYDTTGMRIPKVAPGLAAPDMDNMYGPQPTPTLRVRALYKGTIFNARHSISGGSKRQVGSDIANIVEHYRTVLGKGSKIQEKLIVTALMMVIVMEGRMESSEGFDTSYRISMVDLMTLCSRTISISRILKFFETYDVAVGLGGKEMLFVALALDLCRHRSFFQFTKKTEGDLGGGFGLGPPYVKEGDEIFLVHGLKTPFVFRRAPTDEERYLLVGECYVLGMMDEEAVWSDKDKYLMVV